ncbi:MAG TPA: hypothetical protein VF773_09855 [Verrucomicrobiae bacterium]
MSAAEVIEQIKRLPPEERKAVREFLSTDEQSSRNSTGVEHIDRKDLERTAREIFEEHAPLFRKLAQ